MFGRKAVLPVDFNSQQSYDPVEALRVFNEAPLPDSVDVEACRSEMNAMVKANIEKAQAKQKEQYDRKHTLAGSFSIGALVLKKDFTRKRRRGGTLDFRWLGPYTITTSLGKGLYRLECVKTGAVVNRVNGFHLKPFHAGKDAEPNGKLDSAEQNDAFKEEEQGIFDDDEEERQDDFDGVEQLSGFDGVNQADCPNEEEQQSGFDGVNQADCPNEEEQQSGFDGVNQADCLDKEERQSGFDGVEHADELVDGHWLSCDVINRAQSLLKKQFPQQNGLQSTNALKEGRKWKSVPEQFVQIINDNSHWICTSNRNCRSGEVEIFDSLMQTEVSTTVRRQLATVLHTLRPRMTMTKVRVQEQIGGSDCGLFAIAFAVALVNGQDPAALTFDQGAMRKHLRLCLQRKQLEPFPTTKELKFKKNRVTGREVDSIYCLCRGIWVVGEDDMYQCSACSQWYHESCMLSLSPAHIFNHTWVCVLCS